MELGSHFLRTFLTSFNTTEISLPDQLTTEERFLEAGPQMGSEAILFCPPLALAIAAVTRDSASMLQFRRRFQKIPALIQQANSQRRISKTQELTICKVPIALQNTSERGDDLMTEVVRRISVARK